MATTLTSGSGLLLDPGATAMLSIGNQFTSVSSLRLSGLMRYLKTDELYNKSSFGLQLDYLFNLHALFGGYDPSRLFEMSGVLGAGFHSVARGQVCTESFAYRIIGLYLWNLVSMCFRTNLGKTG